MLFTLLSLIPYDAAGCNPNIPDVYDVFPSAETFPVPTDSIVKVELRNGTVQHDQKIILRRGDFNVDVEMSMFTRTIDSMEEHTFLELVPHKDLSPNQEYTVAFMDHNGETEIISTFVTSDDKSEAVLSAPTVLWIEQDFYETSAEHIDNCTPSSTTELYFEFGTVENASNYSIHLYRIESPQSVFNPDELPARFHSVLTHSGYTTLETKITDTKADEEYCFVARYANEAGVEGPLSEMVCSSFYQHIPGKCGTTGFGIIGCSSLGLSSASLLTLIMSLFGLVLRRRE